MGGFENVEKLRSLDQPITMNRSRVNVLTYNQPHRKTQDLLLRLKIKGYEDINVLATPGVERKNYTPLIPHRNFPPLKITPHDLCQKLGYGFKEIDIRDLNEIEGRILIGGAGILPKEVIDKRQTINSHPVYLPYVRGLDALKWAVYQGKPIGVTTHVISEECDAGQLINQKSVPLYAWDTFHSVA